MYNNFASKNKKMSEPDLWPLAAVFFGILGIMKMGLPQVPKPDLWPLAAGFFGILGIMKMGLVLLYHIGIETTTAYQYFV